MRKKVNMKVAIPIMAGVLILVFIMKCFGLMTFRSGMRFGFAGNDGIHLFNGSYAKITGTMSHTLSPSKGSTSVHCEITTDSGTLHVQILQKADDTVLLDQDFSGNETFDLAADGKIQVKLTTEGHSGSYRFQY
ncbi:MAG: hypothetical protein K5891_05650 [Lachnospiraceae bacterium]|nr:hypothetical protein [Lachnospiraceae bacterium]